MNTNEYWITRGVESLVGKAFRYSMSILAFLLALVAFCIRTETGHDTITDILLLLVLLLFMVFGVAGKKLITTFVSPERIALEGQHLKNLDDLEIDRQRQKDFAADNGA